MNPKEHLYTMSDSLLYIYSYSNSLAMAIHLELVTIVNVRVHIHVHVNIAQTTSIPLSDLIKRIQLLN